MMKKFNLTKVGYTIFLAYIKSRKIVKKNCLLIKACIL